MANDLPALGLICVSRSIGKAFLQGHSSVESMLCGTQQADLSVLLPYNAVVVDCQEMIVIHLRYLLFFTRRFWSTSV